MNYKGIVEKLAPLESFDPKVFRGDERISQKLCDFILALSLAYNDLRDSTLALIMLNEIEVEDDNNPSPQLGLRNGLRVTAQRIQIGFINELLALVATSNCIFNEQDFKALLSKLSHRGRKSWNSIQTAACENKSDDPLVKALIIIRNKVAFHYDASQIGKAYKLAFINKSEYGKPVLSRGSTMGETRFYFADAVTQKYIRERSTQKIVVDFLDGKGALLEDINYSLFELITKFINTRSAWQKFY